MPTLLSEDDSPTRNLELKQRIENYLFSRSPLLLDAVSIDCRDETVVLKGSLPTFYLRQLCINSCQRVAGVMNIQDEIVVKDGSLREWLADRRSA